MTTSASNERQIRAKVQQAHRDLLTEEVVIRQLMSTVEGRRWVWLTLSSAGIFDEDTALDPMLLAYRKGVRNSALRLLKPVQSHTPNEYILMTSEATKVELTLTKEDTPDGRSLPLDPSDPTPYDA